MICNKCKRDIPTDSKFCPYCGNKDLAPTIENNANYPTKKRSWIKNIIPLMVIIALVIALAYTSINQNQLQTDILNKEKDLENMQSTLDDVNKKLNQAQSDLYNAQKDIEEYKSQATYWKDKFTATDPNNVSYSYEFESVETLVEAIKKAPSEYYNKNVKVLATVYRNDKGSITIFDTSDEYVTNNMSSIEFLIRLNRTVNLDAHISDNMQYAVVASGDFVKLYGTVKTANGEVYLDNCQYDMISSVTERTK